MPSPLQEWPIPVAEPFAVGCGMLLAGLVVAADGCETESVAAVWNWRPGPREAGDSSGCRASAARLGV